MMPVGIITNCLSIFFGGLIGATCRERIPTNLKVTLPMIFATCAFSLGINLIVKVVNLQPVVLALILGTAVGVLLDIEGKLHNAASKLQTIIQKGQTQLDEKAIESFITILVLFSSSANLLIGSLYEGMTGDSFILIIKSILDFFTAMIFATTIGPMIVFTCIPALAVSLSLFSLASFIMPYISETMIADFTACGGIITLLVGIRMMELKKVPVANALPAILLVMPLSHLWTLLF
jgi:uncharacterized membrane protein YqgA involved in biofilm formation